MKVPLFSSIMVDDGEFDTTRTIFQVIGDAMARSMAVSVVLFALDTFRQEQNNEGLLSDVSVIRDGPICIDFSSLYRLETSISQRTLRVCVIGEENHPTTMMVLRKRRDVFGAFSPSYLRLTHCCNSVHLL